VKHAPLPVLLLCHDVGCAQDGSTRHPGLRHRLDDLSEVACADPVADRLLACTAEMSILLIVAKKGPTFLYFLDD
jgi:hypothetical protein